MNQKLTDNQRILVEENLCLIDYVIRKYIGTKNSLRAVEYEDLYQVGAIGLCKAAGSYKEDREVEFNTYAFTVIKNELFNHLKQINRSKIELEELKDKASSHYSVEKELIDKYFLQALSATKTEYKGCNRIGIEAMELSLQGYTCRDIAKRHNVKPSYITACISRAKASLRKNELFKNSVI